MSGPLVGEIDRRDGRAGIEVMFGNRGPVWVLTEDGRVEQRFAPTTGLYDLDAEVECERYHCEDGDCEFDGECDCEDADEAAEQAHADLTEAVLDALSTIRVAARVRAALAQVLGVGDHRIGRQR